MKHIKSIIWLTLFLSCLSLYAQDAVITPEMAATPFKDWQLNLTTLFVASQVVGRIIAAIGAGGGLVGIFKGIWFGTNTPKA